MDDDISIAEDVEDIAKRTLVPGRELSAVYRGLFEALSVIAAGLDEIKEQLAKAGGEE